MSFDYCLNGLNPLTALTPLQSEEEYQHFVENFPRYRSIYEGCDRRYPANPPRNIPALMNERLSHFLKGSPHFVQADSGSQREMVIVLVDRTEGPIERGFLPLLPAGGAGGALLSSGGLAASSGVKALHKRGVIGIRAEPIVRLPSRLGHWWYPVTIGIPLIVGLLIGLGLIELSYHRTKNERNEKIDTLLNP